jgi:hypothetical protein
MIVNWKMKKAVIGLSSLVSIGLAADANCMERRRLLNSSGHLRRGGASYDQLATLEQELQGAQRSIAERTRARDAACAEKARLEQELRDALAARGTELVAVNTEKTKLEQNLRTAQQDFTAKEAELVTINTEKAQLKQDLQTAQQDFTAKEAELVTVRADVNSLKVQMKILRMMTIPSTTIGVEAKPEIVSLGNSRVNGAEKDRFLLSVIVFADILLDGITKTDNDFLILPDAFAGGEQHFFKFVGSVEERMPACLHNDPTQRNDGSPQRVLDASYEAFVNIIEGQLFHGLTGGANVQLNALVGHIEANIAAMANDGTYVRDFLEAAGLAAVGPNSADTDDLHSIFNVRWHLVRAMVSLAEFGNIKAAGGTNSDGVGYTLRTTQAFANLIDIL